MAKLDAKRYKWFEYKGKKLTLTLKDRSMTFVKGHLFGVKIVSGKYYFVDINLEFTLQPPEATALRMISNSKGFKGKIGTVPVSAGEGGLDTFDRTSGDLRIDSNMFIRGKYNASKKLLTLEFVNRAVWQYKDVSAKEIMEFEKSKSQGRFYNERIKGVKEGDRLNASYESVSSNAPQYYVAADLPEPNAYEFPSRFNLGTRVALAFGQLIGEKPRSIVRGCVVGGIHFYPGKTGYDLYVPDGQTSVQNTSEGTPVIIDTYTLFSNIDSTCLYENDYDFDTLIDNTHHAFRAVSSSESIFYNGVYELSDLPSQLRTKDGEVSLDAAGKPRFYEGDRVSLYVGKSVIHWCVVERASARRVGDPDDLVEYDLFVPFSQACNIFGKVNHVPRDSISLIVSDTWPTATSPFAPVDKELV